MKKKIYEYDILRIIATIMVVIGHSAYTSISTVYGGVNYILPENISAVYNSNLFYFIRILSGWVYKFHMPLFFILSGAIYKIVEKPDERLDTLVLKKVKRLVIPYLLAGIFFMFPIKLFTNFYNSQTIFDALSVFLKGGDSGHLWFLLALFWCFVVFYICNKYIGRKSIFVLLILAYVIQQKSYLINIDFGGLQTGLSYFFWFTLGYCFELIRNKINIINKWLFFITGVFIIVIDYLNGYFLDTYSCIIIYSLCAYLFADLIYVYFHRIVESKIFKILSRNAMFIYLFHDPLEYICLKYAFHYNILTTNWGCYLYLTIRTIGVILISIIIGEVIYFINHKLKNRHIAIPS